MDRKEKERTKSTESAYYSIHYKYNIYKHKLAEIAAKDSKPITSQEVPFQTSLISYLADMKPFTVARTLLNPSSARVIR